MTTETPDEWALVEVFGHRSHAGRITEVERFGAKMLRIDEFNGEATEPSATHFYGGGSIFSVSPVSEAIARAHVAKRDRWRQTPPALITSISDDPWNADDEEEAAHG